MTREHLDLDRAIDHVAKRLTHVDEDAQFATRVIAALPERVSWFGWLTHGWAPRLAMMAIIAGTIAFWSQRHTTEVAPSAPPLASVVNTSWPQLVASIAREPLAPVRTMPVEPVEPLEPLEPFVGLPPVPMPVSAEIAALTTEEIPAARDVTVAPLVIADLPLTAESFPQRY